MLGFLLLLTSNSKMMTTPSDPDSMSIVTVFYDLVDVIVNLNVQSFGVPLQVCTNAPFLMYSSRQTVKDLLGMTR